MVKICQTGLLTLNFEIVPKKRIFRFLPKISAGHAWSWKIILANFQILGPLGCQGWVVIPQNVKKSKNHCTLQCTVYNYDFDFSLSCRRVQGPFLSLWALISKVKKAPPYFFMRFDTIGESRDLICLCENHYRRRDKGGHSYFLQERYFWWVKGPFFSLLDLITKVIKGFTFIL